MGIISAHVIVYQRSPRDGALFQPTSILGNIAARVLLLWALAPLIGAKLDRRLTNDQNGSCLSPWTVFQSNAAEQRFQPMDANMDSVDSVSVHGQCFSPTHGQYFSPTALDSVSVQRMGNISAQLHWAVFQPSAPIIWLHVCNAQVSMHIFVPNIRYTDTRLWKLSLVAHVAHVSPPLYKH
jgi:hypothetical protein